MPIIQNNEVVNGSLAQVIVISTVNGVQQITDVYQLRQLEATINFNNVEVNRLGTTAPMYLQRGWTGTGTMSFFYGSNILARLVEQYIDDNLQVQFDVVVTNEDPNSSSVIGSQIVQLHNCKPESFDLVMIDVDSDFLTNDFDFVFEDVSILKHWDFAQ